MVGSLLESLGFCWVSAELQPSQVATSSVGHYHWRSCLTALISNSQSRALSPKCLIISVLIMSSRDALPVLRCFNPASISSRPENEEKISSLSSRAQLISFFILLM